MKFIPDYIKGKHDPGSVHYLHDSFKSILEPTYGVAVYQEQILQLARDFAGFTLGEADILRKAVGKKIASLLTEQRQKFIDGAVKNGHKKKFAEEVFDKVIEPFAGYGFNKAHAVCYGLIAYQTAYLKAHFPIEFMTALLCSDAANTDRVVLEIKECVEMKIDVLPPSINESCVNFTVVEGKTIRFGLMAIKGVGEGSIMEIIAARDKGGKFKNIEDMAKRVPAQLLNKKLIQALAHSGAFDEFGDRNQIAENFDEISKFAKHAQETHAEGQTDIFGMMMEDENIAWQLKLRSVEKLSNMQKLRLEKSYLGMYVSGHPLRGLKKYLKKKTNLIGDLKPVQIGKQVKILGTIGNLKRITTKNGGYMMTFVVEDITGKVNAIMFMKPLLKFGSALVEDKIIGLTGKFDHRRGQYQVLCDTAKILSLETMVKNAKDDKLYDPNDRSDIAVRFVDDILAEESENENVIEDFDLGKDIFTIEIPAGLKSDSLKNLKNLLQGHAGQTGVELHLHSIRKKVKLPFGIDLNEELKHQIEKITKH
ncbi:hypothetical protein HYW82_02670, partial [Candidatus Peregrinibacteria bacterium]|nr:hypothetical protein [Candidatus Peregrinibacteria bacterium]